MPAPNSIERVTALAAPIAAELELELVAVEIVRETGRRTLRVTIDRPGGVSHAHCAALSRKLDRALDATDIMGEQSYYLEVSSPGVDHPRRSAGSTDRSGDS